MPFDVDPSFGTFNFFANNCDITNWQADEITTRPRVATVPRSHVARAVPGYLAPRGITVTGIIAGDDWTTRADLRAAEDALKSAHRPGIGFQKLRRDSDRYIMAEPLTQSYGDDTGLLWIPFTLRYQAADPFYYADTAEPTDTWATPAGTHDVTNGGGAWAAPIFTITITTGGALALTLTNDDALPNPKGFTLSGTVADGDVIVVDCRETVQTVTLNGALAMSLFAGDFWLLEPTGNILDLDLTGNTAVIASIATDFTKRWL